jgi:predicted alpha/beta-hydrolase family hydrolase
LAALGIEARGIALSGTNAERAAREYVARSGRGQDIVIGGRSFGGRVASLAAADPANEFGAVVAFAYPLHPPGAPHALRTDHWPRIRCPVLIIQGDADPFGTPDELRREVARLANASLVILPGTGHSLKGQLPAALAAAADWINALKIPRQ